MRTPSVFAAFLLSTFLVAPIQAAPASYLRALVGATLVDGRGGEPVPRAVVLIRDGEIECAGSRDDCPVPRGAEVVELAGRWITPGIVDAHVHFSQTGWADGRPDALDVRESWPYEETVAELRGNPDRLFRSFLCSGVTAVYDVGGYPWTMELPDHAAQVTPAPHVAAAGPLVSTLDHWVNLPGERQFLYAENESVVREQVRYLESRNAHAVKVWYLDAGSREAEVVQAAGDEARRHGLPLIVHATELETAKSALRAGAKLLVHSVWDRPIDDELLALVRENDAVYSPTLTVMRGYQRFHEAAFERRVPAIDDPNGCVSPWVRKRIEATSGLAARGSAAALARREESLAERERIGAANLKRLAGAGVTIAMGTDAGNPLTLHGPSIHAEMEAMQAAGLSPMEVLVASTLGGAKAMGMEDRIGSVETGKSADLLVIAADPTADTANLRRITHVVRGGVVTRVRQLSWDDGD